MPPKPRTAATAAHCATVGATRVVKAPAGPPAADPRLPAPGAAIVRQYKGRQVRVIVRPDGFEFDGRRALNFADFFDILAAHPALKVEFLQPG
jgi:hypothetical protein